MRNKTIIIGGGIAGLTLGLFLKKLAMDCEIFEARPGSDLNSGGMTIAPNGMAVLEHLGLPPKLYSCGSVALENCFYNEKGEIIAKFKNFDPDAYGLPAVSLSRFEFYNILLQECVKKNVKVNFDKRLIAIEQTTKGVTATFEDNTQEDGAILIGADGVNSATRSLIFPSGPKPEFVGLIATGGTVSSEKVPIITTREKQSVNFIFGPKGFFGYIGIKNGDVLWWSNLARTIPLTPSELNSPTLNLTNELGNLFQDYHFKIRTLIAKSSSTATFNIYDIQSLDQWHLDRVLLIGDAAHAVSPNAGQGASMALEDVSYLAMLLKGRPNDHVGVFKSFQSGRKERVEKIVAVGRKRGKDKVEISKKQAKIREQFMKIILPIFGARSQKWLYNYRVDWDEDRLINH